MSQLSASQPRLPAAPEQYDRRYQDQLTNVLRLYFNQLNNPGNMGASTLNFNLDVLPTDADYVNLRYGDVYRDTEGGTLHDGTNVLRIKVPGRVTGVSASGAVGSVGFAEIFGVTGVSGVGAVRSVGVTRTIQLTGVSGAGAVGTVTP